jgi:hypothetical protein
VTEQVKEEAPIGVECFRKIHLEQDGWAPTCVEQLCGSLDCPKFIMQGATFDKCTLVGPDKLCHSRGKAKREGLGDELAKAMDQGDRVEVT